MRSRMNVAKLTVRPPIEAEGDMRVMATHDARGSRSVLAAEQILFERSAYAETSGIDAWRVDHP